MTFSIRGATLKDAEILAEIHRACFPNYWNVDEFNNFFSVKNTFASIAQNPQPIGMAVYRVAGEDADIMTIAILPQFRRRGIARTLLEMAMDKAKSLGATQMFLDVEDGNASAIALYEKFGFTHQRRRKQYYRHRDGSFTDALVMYKKLV